MDPVKHSTAPSFSQTALLHTRGGARKALTWLWPILGLLLVIRLGLAACCNLLPDEAFYWIWTRHLAGGYFDHPPMIAYLMWLSTRVLGDTPIGVRLPSVVLSLASVAVIVWLARRLLRDDRAAGFVAIMWIVSPLLAVMGIVFTPDTPAMFFSVCALACAAIIADTQTTHESDAKRAPSHAPLRPHKADTKAYIVLLWLAFGVFCGLAFLSKYTSIVVPAGVFLALLSSPTGRRHLRQPWIYLAGLIALAVFSPVLVWNARHGWVSFLFQLHHGADEGIAAGAHGFLHVFLLRLGGFGEFLGGQVLVWTPILFLLAVIVLWKNWRRYFQLSDVDRILLWSGTLPLILFGWAATRSRGEMNWPAFAYFPLSLLLGRYLTENWSEHRIYWTNAGCRLALAFSLVLHILALPGVAGFLLGMHIPMQHNLTDLYGWRDFGRQIGEQANGLPVVCNRHQDAGEAEFYMPGQPPVWCDSVGSRPTAFDYFDKGLPDYSRIGRLLFVGSHVDEFAEKHGYTRVTIRPSIVMPGPGRHRSRPSAIVEREEKLKDER